MSTLTIRWAGGEHTAQPGTTVRIGREHDNDVRSSNANVSRHHLEISSTPAGWVVRDLGSGQGTWHDSARVTTLTVVGPTTLHLGQPPGGERLELLLTPVAGQEATAVVGAESASPQSPVVSAPGGAPGTVILGEQNRPGGALRSGDTAAATVVTGDTLTIEVGGTTRTLARGERAVLGRESDCTIVCANPTVSRRHAEVSHDGQGWVITDLGSTGGTFVDGRKVTQHRLVGSTPVMLGSPDAGERVVLVTQGQRRVPRTGSNRGLLVAIAAVAVVALLAAGLAIWVARSGGPNNDELARATVRLSYVAEFDGERSQSMVTGSGTIIDAERGLILTNAHVAAPQTPGQGVLYGKFDIERPDDPDLITIAIAPGLDKSAEPRFLGEVVAADGYLDLAVVKITRKLSGNAIEDGDLAGLTSVEIGRSADVSTGDEISIFGYPGVADSAAATLTRGSISGSVRDERIGENRSWFNLDADIRGGNSGGLAVNQRGKLIGVPHMTRRDPSRDESINRMIPIDLAAPLIAAARNEKSYEPTIATPLDGQTIEQVRYFEGGIAAGASLDCSPGEPTAPRGRAFGVIIDFSGFTPGQHEDLMVQVLLGDELVGYYSTAEEYPLDDWPESGCVIIGVPLVGATIDDLVDVAPLIGLGANYEVVR